MRRWMTLAFVAAACGEPVKESEPHPRIVDQSGAEFFWACDDTCQVHRIAGVSPPLPECSERLGLYGIARARFFGVVEMCPYPAATGWGGWDLGERRYLVCEDVSDCPQVRDGAFECRAGFCQNADTEEFPPALLEWLDLKRLCTGDVSRGEDDEPSPELTDELAVACPDGRCLWIPDGCPDPR